MIYLAFALIFVASLAAGTTLVMLGHPWFALLVFLIGGSISIRRGNIQQ
jgi:hypothetical protein